MQYFELRIKLTLFAAIETGVFTDFINLFYLGILCEKFIFFLLASDFELCIC